MTVDLQDDAPAAGLDPAAVAAAIPDEQADARVRVLFRLWLREGHIHPLIHLMQRYRCEANR